MAVAFDGTIYRATDAEITDAFAKTKRAPPIDPATYVKAVEEILRRRVVLDMALSPGRSELPSQINTVGLCPSPDHNGRVVP